MIISIAAAALASAQPATTAPAPVPMPAMEHHDTAAGKDKAMAKMDCCKDGCACCKHDEAGKAEPAKH